jgi:acetyl esterase/lipase
MTGPAIQQCCKSRKIYHKTVTLDKSTVSFQEGLDVPCPTLHFLTPLSTTSATGPTILYFFGGGYTYPISGEPHVVFAMHCAASSKAKNIVLLDYALAPEHKYPSQLVQAVAALRYLLVDKKISSADIIIGGDSSGGQLVASLLAHIAQPSPYAAPIDLGGVQIRAALFISPWLSMKTDQPSFSTNSKHDYITEEAVLGYITNWAPKTDEVWANVLDSRDSIAVWGRVFTGDTRTSLVKKAIAAAGTAEVFLDQTQTFGEKFMHADVVSVHEDTDMSVLKSKDFVLALAVNEIHVEVAVDAGLGYDHGRMTRAIMSFLESV